MNNNEILLLKLGEVVLKGLNRKVFEDRLLNNVRRRLRHCGSFQVYVRQSTIYVEPQDASCDLESAYAACRQVFGIAAVARAVPCEKTVEAITATAKAYLAGSFAAARRKMPPSSLLRSLVEQNASKRSYTPLRFRHSSYRSGGSAVATASLTPCSFKYCRYSREPGFRPTRQWYSSRDMRVHVATISSHDSGKPKRARVYSALWR